MWRGIKYVFTVRSFTNYSKALLHTMTQLERKILRVYIIVQAGRYNKTIITGPHSVKL